MKALKIILIVVASLVLIGGGGYLYASSGIKAKPGYAKLTTPANALLSINVGRGGLRPVRWLLKQATESSDHGNKMPKRLLETVLQDLQGVQLRVYDVASNRQAFDKAIADSVAALKQQSWQTLMTVRDGDEQIAVLQYGDNDKIEGLSIMVSTPENAVFLNLIGPFDPSEILETANQIN